MSFNLKLGNTPNTREVNASKTRGDVARIVIVIVVAGSGSGSEEGRESGFDRNGSGDGGGSELLSLAIMKRILQKRERERETIEMHVRKICFCFLLSYTKICMYILCSFDYRPSTNHRLIKPRLAVKDTRHM